MAARLFVQRHFEELPPPSCRFRNIIGLQSGAQPLCPVFVDLSGRPEPGLHRRLSSHRDRPGVNAGPSLSTFPAPVPPTRRRTSDIRSDDGSIETASTTTAIIKNEQRKSPDTLKISRTCASYSEFGMRSAHRPPAKPSCRARTCPWSASCSNTAGTRAQRDMLISMIDTLLELAEQVGRSIAVAMSGSSGLQYKDELDRAVGKAPISDGRSGWIVICAGPSCSCARFGIWFSSLRRSPPLIGLVLEFATLLMAVL